MCSRELLFSLTRKDFEIQTFCSGGKGGQYQNKTESGVRIIHRASGAVGEARDSRGQYRNRKAAFLRLTQTPKFKAWLKIECAKKTGEFEKTRKAAEKRVDDWMDDKYLKVEYF